MKEDQPRNPKGAIFRAPFNQRSYVENMELEDPEYDQILFHLQDGRVPIVVHGEALATGDYWELAMEPVLDTFEDAGTPRKVASVHTLQQVADLFGCNRENIRRIEMNALRKLQRFKALRSYLGPRKKTRVLAPAPQVVPLPVYNLRIGASYYWIDRKRVLRVRLVQRLSRHTMQTAGGFVVADDDLFATRDEAEAELALRVLS